MISRRFLRVKAMQIIYAHYKTGSNQYEAAEKELYQSIRHSYDMYFFLSALIIQVQEYAQGRIDISRQKLIPTEEDLNPNMKFVHNQLITQLKKNEQLQSVLKRTKFSWNNHPELVRNVYQSMIESDYYKNYMADEIISYDEDKKFVSKLYAKLIPFNEFLYQMLEEENIYWNDEVEFVLSRISSTLKGFKESEGVYAKFLPMFQSHDDEDFVKILLKHVIRNKEKLDTIITDHVKNWDLERIAYLDIVLMKLAIAELLNFKEIPANVTFNEYIEIAKHYSTDKSNLFINGVLDKIKMTLQKDKLIPEHVGHEYKASKNENN